MMSLCMCSSKEHKLQKWIQRVMDKKARVVNFDLWGLMPSKGDSCDFKICELAGDRGWTPKQQVEGQKVLEMKEGAKPVPFFIALYFSVGFGAYMVARFQLNRHG